MPDQTIRTENLTKKFSKFTAVDSLNMEVDRGELFGFLGPNGAGKTTTVRLLCTLLAPTRGTATVAGYDILKQPAEVRRNIGVVSDGVLLYKDLTIEENLRFLSTVYDLPRHSAEGRIKELLDFFDFREKAQRLVGHLSSGWTKKAMVCAALLHNPKILFLDEVTSGLDPQSAIALRDFTRKLCDEGVTVIWTTHYMEEPEKICDRVGVIFGGRMIRVGTPSELRRSVSEVLVIEVETPRLKPEQLNKVKELNHVAKVTYEDPVLRITGEKDGSLTEDVAKVLLDTGARIRAINTKEPTLEEAFITLTSGEDKVEQLLAAGGPS